MKSEKANGKYEISRSNMELVWSKLFDFFSPLDFFSQSSCYIFLENI